MTRLLLALLALSINQAHAQDRPLAFPARDVDVTYHSEQSGQIFEQRSRFDAASQRMRLDTPTKGLYLIVDYNAKRMSLITDADKGVLDMPAPTGVPGLASPEPGQSFSRQGTDQVAGQSCTEWETRDNRSQPVQTCFTADGVLLRARRGAAILAIATQVTYGRMDPSLFEIPPNYQWLARRAPGP